MKPLVLGVDPGFANFGYCLAWLESDDTITPFEMGTIQTKPNKDVSAAEDLLDRCTTIAETLQWRVRKVIDDASPHAVCIEGMSFPRNASSAVKLGASHGMMAGFLAQWVPESIYVRSPQHIRKTITGCKGKAASESLTHTKLLRRYPDMSHKFKAMLKSEQPHALDALATIEAARLEQAFV